MVTTAGLIERYELKYRLPPDAVDAVRAVVARYCRPDEEGDGGSYTISSLYLDTADRRLYRETIDQAPRRFKLRVRRYVDGPVFLETKRRLKDVVRKSRAAVPATAWPALLHDPAVESELRLGPEVTAFVNRILRYRAEPAVVVRYQREAWVSRLDDYGRVTFDSRLTCSAPDGWTVPIADGPQWVPFDAPSRFALPISGVVLELKCTAAVPSWMIDLARRFGLRREGFSKYGRALESIERPEHGRDLAAAGGSRRRAG